MILGHALYLFVLIKNLVGLDYGLVGMSLGLVCIVQGLVGLLNFGLEFVRAAK